MGDVTRILSDIESGDSGAAEQLLPLIYDELRRLAAAKMAGESPDHTLQATALMHEAYLRLVDVDRAQHWDSRGHFYVAAAEAMRQLLITSARRKNSLKRGGNQRRVNLELADLAGTVPSQQLLALSDALDQLSERDPTKAELVKLRFFAGMTIAEAASTLGISSATAERHWSYARAWLQCQVSE